MKVMMAVVVTDRRKVSEQDKATAAPVDSESDGHFSSVDSESDGHFSVLIERKQDQVQYKCTTYANIYGISSIHIYVLDEALPWVLYGKYSTKRVGERQI